MALAAEKALSWINHYNESIKPDRSSQNIEDISLFDQNFFIYFNPISFRRLRLVVPLDIK